MMWSLLYGVFFVVGGAGGVAMGYGLWAALAGEPLLAAVLPIMSAVGALWIGGLGLYVVHSFKAEEEARVARWGPDWDRGIA